MNRVLACTLALLLAAPALPKDNGKIKDPADKNLATALKALKSKSAKVRLKGIKQLAEMGTKAAPEASGPLVLALFDRVPAINEAALDALEKVNPEVHKPIVTILVDKQMPKKADAVKDLGKFGAKGKPAIPFLIHFYRLQMANRTHLHYFDCDILNALKDIDPGNKAVQATLLGAVAVSRSSTHPTNPNYVVDSQARALAIGIILDLVNKKKVKGSQAVRPLVSALADVKSRLQATKALGTLGADAKDAVPVLTRLKKDGEATVRDAATEALKKIQK